MQKLLLQKMSFQLWGTWQNCAFQLDVYKGAWKGYMQRY